MKQTARSEADRRDTAATRTNRPAAAAPRAARSFRRCGGDLVVAATSLLALAFVVTLALPSSAARADTAVATKASAAEKTAPAEKTALSKAAPKPADEERKVIPRAGRALPWYEAPMPAPDVVSRVPFKAGEHILFKLRVLGKEAGWGEARVGRRTRKSGTSVLPIEVLIKSSGLFDKVYPVHDEAKTWFDLATFTPVQSEMTLRENKKERDVSLWFGGRHMGRVKGHQVKDEKRERVDDRSPLRAYDPLSAFYAMRTRKLVEGQSFVMYVHNGLRMYRIDVKVVGKEKVFTDVGLLPSWKLQTKIKRADGSRPEWHQDMTFWLSEDRLRLPLKLSFDMTVGKVEATLAGVKGVKGRKDLAPPKPAKPAKAAAAAPAVTPVRGAAQ